MNDTEYTGLFSADIHMNNNLPHAKPTADGRTDRMEDQIKLWERFGKIAGKVGAEHFWIAGDLFDHGRIDAVTLAETARVTSGFPVPMCVMPGNHDAHTIRGGRFNLEAFGHLAGDRIVYVGGRPTAFYCPRPWLVFWPLEFMPVEDTRSALHDIREQIKDGLPQVESRERMDVLLMHNSIEGCQHAGWVCDDGLTADEVCEGFDYVIAGHFHDTQTFGPDDNGMYLGAPMHHRFSDVGRDAGFWALTFIEGEGMRKRFFNGKSPRFHEADWKGAVGDSDEDVKPNDYLKVKVTATHANWVTERPAVIEAVEELKRRGVRASFKHIPIYHHTARIKGHDGMDAISMDKAVPGYLKAPDVDITGLDRAKLKAIGRAALAAARSES